MWGGDFEFFQKIPYRGVGAPVCGDFEISQKIPYRVWVPVCGGVAL